MSSKKNVVLSTLCGLLSLTACEIDSYDKGEGDYSLMTADFVEAHVGSDKNVGSVETDQGELIQLAEPFTTSWIQKADTTYRAILYYNKVGNAEAKAVSISRVGVVNIGDSVKGGMKTDPLHAESIWLSKNRKYLNLRLRLLTGHTDDAEAIHTIGLVRDTLATTPSHLHLTLYHNQGGRPEYYSTTAYASMPLTAITADTVTLTINTYNGIIVRSFNLKP